MLLLVFLSLFTGNPISHHDAADTLTQYVVPDSTGNASLQGNYVVRKIYLSGNKTTKPPIIYRELTFKINDTIPKRDFDHQLEKSRENLLNTSLFNFVTITIQREDSTGIDVNIDVKERWYTWPVPIFAVEERNFNTWWNNGRNLERADYGLYVMRYNFRGRKEKIGFKAQFGYSKQFGFVYQIPYLNQEKNSGMGMSFVYSHNHEIAYGSANNKLLYYKNPNKYIREEYVGRLDYTYRQGLYNSHALELNYNSEDIDDTIRYLTHDYLVNNQSSMSFLGLEYAFRRNMLDSKAYPLQGYFVSFKATKYGLNILKDDHLDVLFLEGGVQKYWKIGKRFYYATSLRGKASVGVQQPYYLQQGLGYSNYVRGYEYYVIDGQDYSLMKNELRFQIIKRHVRTIPLIPLEKFKTLFFSFYLTAFSDMGYVWDNLYDKQNNLSNTLLFGNGVGIDFVSYYDIVFRAEYSFNRMGESGVFLHFTAPI